MRGGGNVAAWRRVGHNVRRREAIVRASRRAREPGGVPHARSRRAVRVADRVAGATADAVGRRRCRRNQCATPRSAGRSVLFDAEGAADARVRQYPQYVESIVVEGHDPDGRRPKARPLEQRFADALLARPPAASAGLRMMDTTPCMSLQSTWNVFGSSFAPLTGCP